MKANLLIKPVEASQSVWHGCKLALDIHSCQETYVQRRRRRHSTFSHARKTPFSLKQTIIEGQCEWLGGSTSPIAQVTIADHTSLFWPPLYTMMLKRQPSRKLTIRLQLRRRSLAVPLLKGLRVGDAHGRRSVDRQLG